MDGGGEHSMQDPQLVLLISFTDLLLPNVPLDERALSLVLAASPSTMTEDLSAFS